MRGLRESKENTRSLTLSGLWLDLCFRSLRLLSLQSKASASCFYMERTYIQLVCVLLQQYPFDIPTEAFSFEIFKQAFAAVQSCVVHLQVMFHSLLDFFSFTIHITFLLLEEYIQLILIIWS